MASAEKAKLQYEAGQDAFPMEKLLDSGDAKIFTSQASLFSNRSGSEPDVRPNGVLTGGEAVAAVSGSNNVVDMSQVSANLNGVITVLSAQVDIAIVRAATDVASITSVTMDNAGVIDVVIGTDSADATLSEDRAAAGGPPLIPIDSVELFQIRTTTNAAGPIAQTEIFQVVGIHLERADFPVFDINFSEASVEFLTNLPLIHVGAIAKAVHASYADPIFADVSLANEFVPAETSHAVTSTQIYGSTIGASSSSLAQATFIAFLNDGITDPIVALKNETLWFKFFANRFKAPFILTLGKLGVSRSFPTGDTIQSACTISADTESIERAS